MNRLSMNELVMREAWEVSGRQKIIIGVGRSLYGHRSEGPKFLCNK
ncbi:hypothetical protein VCSRO22_0100 [Vibrio cholerae]|nr:hypothetical protein VCSRO22_0100 [Vibrio cholerae]GIA30811.1 hypothetical protein VCSRO38_0569 [Vibrio cholerae]